MNESTDLTGINKASKGSVYDQINRNRSTNKVRNIQKKIGNKDDMTEYELNNKIKNLEDNINKYETN